MYVKHIDFVSSEFHGRNWIDPKIIEFGGSNHLIKNLFDHCNYEIAPNYPEVDLQDLRRYQDDSYDFVVLDEVLEHVRRPDIAIAEVWRILKPGGCLMTSSPFLIAVHKCPDDYWRFTKDGLRTLLAPFSRVEAYSWGSSFAACHLFPDMMTTTREARERGIFDLTNQENFPITVWAYAWK